MTNNIPTKVIKQNANMQTKSSKASTAAGKNTRRRNAISQRRAVQKETPKLLI
jgi:hypothetical protein